MKKSIIAVVLTVALIVSFSWSRPAEATWTLYDDFSGSTIDSSKWYTPVLSGDSTVGLDGSGNLALSGNGVFSVALGATVDVSSIKGGAFTYSAFETPNNVSNGAGIYLAVGNPNSGDFYAIYRARSVDGNFLLAISVTGFTNNQFLGFMPYEGEVGGLGIQGNEGNNGLDFIFSASNSSLPDESWSSLVSLKTAQIDDSSAYVWIGAYANDTDSSMNAKIDSFYVKNPVPVPAAVWLLGSGLLGLLGVRRKISN